MSVLSIMAVAALAMSSLTTAAPHAAIRELERACDPSALNTTISSYTIAKYDTIFTIAAATNRGVCDIARANRMADAVILPNPGAAMLIPAQVCHPDKTTCLLVAGNPTLNCVPAGPHTYTGFPNDTIASIALTKFNITVESLWNTSSRMLSGQHVTDAFTVVPTGNNLKLPQCNPSECRIEPYNFVLNATYRDLAEMYGTTPGQIFALNPTYNHSSGAMGPVITMPMKCKILSTNYTEIS
jgi:LysM domain